jgi:hypothetical protein
MPANTLPIYPVTPNWGVAVLSTGLTTRTVVGVAGLTLLLAAGGNGTRVDSITMVATGTTTAGMIRLWKYGGSGNAALISETTVAAIVPSASVASWASEQLPINFTLEAGESLYASTHNSEGFNVHARGGDY